MSDIGRTAGALALFATHFIAAGMLLGIGFKLADKLVNRIGRKKNEKS